MGNLRAGTAMVEISPGKGIELAGYPHYPRHNTGIHDPLYAGCVCLDDGTTRLALVAMDLLFFSKKYVREVRQRLDDSGVIPGANVMFCCSHTHSGPWAAGRLDMEALEQGLGPDEGYVKGLKEKLYNLVLSACGNLFEAGAGLGAGIAGGELGVGGNRRVPGGPCDPSVNVLGVQDASGAWKAAVVSYALHPTALHGENDLVSADYPGYVRKLLRFAFPGMGVLFAQGASGNQSTRYYRDGQTFEEACRIGTTIGVQAAGVLRGMSLRSDMKLAARSAEFMPELRRYPEKCAAERAVEAARENLERLRASGASYIECRNAELKVLGAEDILGYVIMEECGEKPALLTDELPMELQAFRMGDAVILGFQGEVFVEFGLEIKRRSPFGATFTLELANGAAPGYMYTPESLPDGGYETDTSMLGPGAGSMLVDVALKLLNEMKDNQEVGA